MSYRWILLGLCFTAIACDTTATGGDAKNDPIAEPGKADAVYGECEVQQVLGWVNDLTTSSEVLKEAGVHSRAANNIVQHRNGPDGAPGTEDDDFFDDLQELDDVSWVGPVAMTQLVDAVRHRCQASLDVEVIFSPQPMESSHLARAVALIESAVTSIDIAMYSFSDNNILAALQAAVARGVRVRFIFESANADRQDPAGTMSARLEAAGINVRYVNKIMHHKFAIFDGPVDDLDAAYSATLLTGSGNWSYSAGTRYDENTVVVSGISEVALQFQQEFNHLWRNSRDFVWDASLPYEETVPIADAAIVDDPDVDVVFTSANFRTYVSSYGPTFSVINGENAVADRLVALIENATESIHVASGHLRSRPVAQALLDKAAAHPEMDIRVYLDNQEFISEWYHYEQISDLDDCLTAAGSSESAVRSCYDRGFYFSYELAAAGIPLRFKTYCYRWHYTYAVQMHHKYLVFDGKIVASGSYNLSDNAEHNTLENVVIYDAHRFPGLVQSFEANFDAIWVTGEADGLYAALLDEIQNGTESSFPIVFPSMALTWAQVDTLKAAIREHCPTIDSLDFRSRPESHSYCTR